MSTVSVIIPAYNAAHTITNQLRALDAQSDLDFDVLVADNGSTDDTARIVRTWQPRFRTLRLIDASQRRGASAARNAAMAATSAELLLFCDADDRVHRTWVASHRRALEKAPASTGPLRLRWPQAPWRSGVWNETTVPVAMSHLPYMPSCNAGVRRAVITEVSGFDPDLVRGQEDVDLGWRICAAGRTIAHAPGASIDYYQRGGTLSFLRQQFRYGRAYVDLFRKHHDAPLRPAGVKTSLRWFVEWARQLRPALRNNGARQTLGVAVFQAGRCLQCLLTRTRSPL